MNWHRLFGLMLSDFFAGSPFVVELEKDLSLKRQLLDVVVIRRKPGRFTERLPDGLDDLAAHNLITFKSHQEALDAWALKELLGHYVNYRKQVSLANQPMLPEQDFRLYAVTSRFPHNLAGAVPLDPVGPGRYDCRWGTDIIRVVVAGQLPHEEHNAMLHLFSGSREEVVYGAAHYRRRSEETGTLLYRLFKGYKQEGIAMPYTMADWKRDFIKEEIKELAADELREALGGLSVRKRLEGLSPEERLEGLSPEERLEGLSLEEIEGLLNRLRSGVASRRRKPRRGK